MKHEPFLHYWITGNLDHSVPVAQFWHFCCSFQKQLHIRFDYLLQSSLKYSFQTSKFGADATLIHHWLSEASTEAAFPQMYLNKT